MRDLTKTISLPVSGEMKRFHLTKLDAFSGAKLLRALAAPMERHPKEESMMDILFALPEDTFEGLMRLCLRHAEVEMPAGAIRVWSEGGWALPEMACDAALALRLTAEVISWSMSGFFPDAGSTSPPGPRPSSP